ncbi:hypothetical protein ONZ45_g12718 [Pleurotus djamor]|nr:hypothetical protein ONZ45_g12718 [Pleurotus djamor]
MHPTECGWVLELPDSPWDEFFKKCQQDQLYTVGDIIVLGRQHGDETIQVHGTDFRIVIRPEMLDFYERLVLAESRCGVNREQGSIVGGSSGIGKSCSTIFFLARRIQEGHTFLYQNRHGDFILITPDGVYTRPDALHYPSELAPLIQVPDLSSTRAWIILDPGDNSYSFPGSLQSCQTFIVYVQPSTARKYPPVDYKHYETLIMNPWSIDDVNKYL